MRDVRLIGYWRNESHPEYPDPAAFVDESWSDDERHIVGIYLMSGTNEWQLWNQIPGLS